MNESSSKQGFTSGDAHCGVAGLAHRNVLRSSPLAQAGLGRNSASSFMSSSHSTGFTR